MSALILGLLSCSFIVSLLSTGVVKRLAPSFNFVDKPGHRKIHHIPKPLGGGIGIFLGVAIPLVAGLLAVHWLSAQPDSAALHLLHSSLWQTAAIYLPGAVHQTPLALKVLAAMLLMHALGLIDDRKALGPFIKLFAQLAIVAGLVLWADLRAVTFLDQYGMGIWPSVVITTLWIVAISNAFNFLDNMDGLSAGVAAVCTAAFLATALLIGQWFVAAMLAMLLGALLGFLCHNFPPATIFMGDSGSLLIGLLLGVLTIRTTYLHQPLAQGWYEIFAPLIVLAVPLYDLLVVSAIRISRGKSPFVGDTNHFSHRLVARGMSRRTAVLCIYLVTGATSVAAILLPYVQNTLGAMLIFAQTLLILGVVMLLEQHPLPMPASTRREEAASGSETAPR